MLLSLGQAIVKGKFFPFPLALRSLIRNFAKIYKWEKKWRKKTIGYCLTK